MSCSKWGSYGPLQDEVWQRRSIYNLHPCQATSNASFSYSCSSFVQLSSAFQQHPSTCDSSSYSLAAHTHHASSLVCWLTTCQCTRNKRLPPPFGFDREYLSTAAATTAYPTFRSCTRILRDITFAILVSLTYTRSNPASCTLNSPTSQPLTSNPIVPTDSSSVVFASSYDAFAFPRHPITFVYDKASDICWRLARCASPKFVASA